MTTARGASSGHHFPFSVPSEIRRPKRRLDGAVHRREDGFPKAVFKPQKRHDSMCFAPLLYMN